MLIHLKKMFFSEAVKCRASFSNNKYVNLLNILIIVSSSQGKRPLILSAIRSDHVKIAHYRVELMPCGRLDVSFYAVLMEKEVIIIMFLLFDWL